MKFSELKKKSKSELAELLRRNRERLGILRFDLATGKVKNVREIRKIKRDIARILTLINTLNITDPNRRGVGLGRESSPRSGNSRPRTRRFSRVGKQGSAKR